MEMRVIVAVDLEILTIAQTYDFFAAFRKVGAIASRPRDCAGLLESPHAKIVPISKRIKIKN